MSIAKCSFANCRKLINIGIWWNIFLADEVKLRFTFVQCLFIRLLRGRVIVFVWLYVPFWTNAANRLSWILINDEWQNVRSVEKPCCQTVSASFENDRTDLTMFFEMILIRRFLVYKVLRARKINRKTSVVSASTILVSNFCNVMNLPLNCYLFKGSLV